MKRHGGAFVLVALLALLSAPAAARGEGIAVEVVTESGEVNAGETLAAAAVVSNGTDRDRLVLVEGFLAPVEEPIGTPPAGRWERFVWAVLAKITGDCELVHVPAGEKRAVKLDLEVHPRMHGRFDVVATALTPAGPATDRTSVVSKVVAPPTNGGVLVHGMVWEIGPFRVLVTDDGQVYEPTGPKADEMFRLLDELRPRPDGVTVLGGIQPNSLGGIGVELEVDLFRYDRDPGTPVGVRWRHLARGRSPEAYAGPDEEIVRNAERLKQVVDALGAELTGRRPNFRREMVAVVTTAGTSLTTVRVGRVIEKDGVLFVHYVVVDRIGPALAAAPEVFSQPWHLVALPKFAGPIEFVRHDVRVRTDAPKRGEIDVPQRLGLTRLAKLDRRSRLGRALKKEAKARRRAARRAGR